MVGQGGSLSLLADMSDPYNLHEMRPMLMLLSIFITGFGLGFLGFLGFMLAMDVAKGYSDRASKKALGINRRVSVNMKAPRHHPRQQRRPSMSERIGQMVMVLPRQGSKLLASLL